MCLFLLMDYKLSMRRTGLTQVSGIVSNLISYPKKLILPTLRVRRHHMKSNAASSGTLSKQSHLVWVSSKSSNIFLNPLQEQNLIHKAIVTLSYVVTS